MKICKQVFDFLYFFVLFTEFFTYVKNSLGQEDNIVMDSKGFRYLYCRTAKKQGIEIWRCSKRTRGHCKAGIHTFGPQIIHHFEDHNHIPDF